MSYSCDISFKQIPGDEVYEFFQKFKAENIAHLEEIAEDNFVFSPIWKKSGFKVDPPIELTSELRNESEEWAKSHVFKFRYFYNKELQLLGVYGVFKSVQHLFDGTVYFQNSCDQDYERSDWEGIKLFEDIYDKWQAVSNEDIKEKYDSDYFDEGKDDEEVYAYLRRSSAYDEIWKYFENTLYDDSSVVHLSLFGYYDFQPVGKFVHLVYEAYKKDWEEFNEMLKKKKENNKEESEEGKEI